MVRRQSTLRRRDAGRRSRVRLLIVCCGARTETQYLDSLRRHFPGSPIAMRVKSNVDSPSGLVAYAAKLRDQEAGQFDEVWCVFDVDDFAADVEVAVVAAARAEISLAISNPCFEFWLLLHLKDHTAWLNGPRGALEKLTQCLPNYNKAAPDFRLFSPGIRSAIARGRNQSAEGRTHRDNPSTTMWRLAQVIVGNEDC